MLKMKLFCSLFIQFFFTLYRLQQCLSVSSVLYESGYLREYDAFRSVQAYMFSVPQNAKESSFKFRSSHQPDSCDTRKVQIQLQFGSLPLGKNETFPNNFFLDRKDVKEINIVSDNRTLNLNISHPLPGDWFAIAYIPDKDTKLRPKDLFPTCYYQIHIEYISSEEGNIDGVHLNYNYEVRISQLQSVRYRFNIAETALAYHVMISGCVNSKSDSVNCSLSVLTRGQGVPDLKNYDHLYNCSNPDWCIISVPVLYQHGIQYIMFTSLSDLTFTFNVSTSDCKPQDITLITDNETCIIYPLMDRYEFQSVFKTRFMYIINGTEVKKPYNLSENKTLILPYEIKSGIDNGGSVVLKMIVLADQKDKDTDVKILVRACLHRSMPQRSIGSDCPSSAGQLNVNTSTSPVLQDSVVIPYPKAGIWFITLSMSCFKEVTNSSVSSIPCDNRTANVTLDIESDVCVEGRCNDKGSCAVYLQGRLLASTCVCQGGWSGYSCSDGSDLVPFRDQLVELILLVTSHVMFIPAIILALYRKHYVEAFVYFYTMFFSAFYHACDGERDDNYKYCLTDLHVLSFCDFLGSITSIWVTLIAMTRLPRVITSVLYTSAPLLLAVGIEKERTSMYLLVVPAGFGLLLIIITWVSRCYRRHKCYPPCKRYLLCLLPGLLIAGGGLCIFAFAENSENYKYTHSAWHMLMATCTMFLLPPRPAKKELQTVNNRACYVGCLADDPNSTPLVRYRETDSVQNLII